ncbi:MAG: phosphatase PAP2 family protein [Hymenobacter sp.]|nr:MAG: phosphatase PAP2 family protein [Hymenobacter sp.]
MISWRSFLAFTALTLPVCILLVWWADKPLALAFHQYAAGAVPFFTSLTNAVDATYAAANKGGRPTLFWALGLAYLLGRWVFRRRGATVFLIILLTHLASIVSANMLKIAVNRPRPGVLFTPGYTESYSFPSSHTATYWSLFLPLAVAFPRWRWPLLAVPILIALGRLVLGVHYVSDVWAAIWLVAAWTTLFSLLKRWDKPVGMPLANQKPGS